jgi:hypothetical protein
MFSSRSYASFSLHTQIKSNHQGRVSLASAKPDPPSGARKGGTSSASKFSSEKVLPKRLSCILAISVTEPREKIRAHVSGKADRAKGLLRLRDTDTSLVTFREKITLTWISDSATDEHVWILETRGKETQLYNTTTKCSGLGGRERHIHVQNKLLQQNQASPGGGAAPSASSPPPAPFPPSARSAPASDGGASGRISTSKEDASTALGPAAAASSL